ncbi:MAG: hypothetical protein AAGA18_01115 [Verrucomicrobiota bacterium]
MRVTSNLYPEVFKSQLNNLKERQLIFQNQISTGIRVLKPSDDPVDYRLSQQIAADQATRLGYLKTTTEARALVNANYQAMTDLQRALSRLSELSIRGNDALDSSALQSIGQEAASIVEQVVTIANRRHDDNYLFGGTGDVPAIDTSGAPNYVFNAAATANVTQAKISDGNPVNTGIVAGEASNDNPPTTLTTSGFLANSAVNTMFVIQDIRDTLTAGNPVTSAQISNLNEALELTSEFVGVTAAQLATLDLNESALEESVRSGAERISEHTSANLTDAATELNRTQLHYEAALQSGARILNITLLDFV